MLVLSRRSGESVSIRDQSESSLLTVLSHSDTAKLFVNLASHERTGFLESKVIELGIGQKLRVPTATITLVDLDYDKIRLGTEASNGTMIQRLELMTEDE